MTTQDLFQTYEFLADRADAAFRDIKKSNGQCVKCGPGCADCCHAVFGLFLIEAGYLKQRFDTLSAEIRKDVLSRINETERGLKRLESKMRTYAEDSSMQAYILATERVRCPLLDESDECVLYSHRPITCRVYGIPTRIQGKARVCGKAGFEKGKAYPTFDLDAVYKDLFALSKELLAGAGGQESEKASLLISVPKAIVSSFEDLIHEEPESR